MRSTLEFDAFAVYSLGPLFKLINDGKSYSLRRPNLFPAVKSRMAFVVTRVVGHVIFQKYIILTSKAPKIFPICGAPHVSDSYSVTSDDLT